MLSIFPVIKVSPALSSGRSIDKSLSTSTSNLWVTVFRRGRDRLLPRVSVSFLAWCLAPQQGALIRVDEMSTNDEKLPLKMIVPLTVSSYYFIVICPHNARVFGLNAHSYASALFHWSANHEIIRHTLIGFALCSLIPRDRSGEIRAATFVHRRQLLYHVQGMLATNTIDDILVYGLSLLIPVDGYLGFGSYSRTHVLGFGAVIKAHGGFEQVGQSTPPVLRDAVVASALIAQNLLLCHEAPPPLSYRRNHSMPLESPLQLRALSNLPRGFLDLIQGGYLSPSMIEVLQSFSAWDNTYTRHKTNDTPTWLSPTPTPSGSTHLEKCIFLSLRCLADDTSAMALHPAYRMYRQTEKRAGMLLALAYSEQESWIGNSLLSDCLVWLVFVICTPINAENVAEEMQKEVFRTLLLPVIPERGSLAWEDVQRILRCFFYDERRAHVWEGTRKKFFAEY
ncbi:hypothetical protein BJX66DRAFT_318071 [Aspergillus keveii]|uniref:Fungal-specific transcription factor domain-containing protein n=1 Tax=Aspergillus keveii TaxID=714993 RepID=A0ABR4FKU6_9EURO